MTIPSILQLPREPYSTVNFDSDPTLKELEKIVFLKEEAVKQPELLLSDEEYLQAEIGIVLARKAVTYHLSVLHERNEIEDKLNLNSLLS